MSGAVREDCFPSVEHLVCVLVRARSSFCRPAAPVRRLATPLGRLTTLLSHGGGAAEELLIE